MTAPGRTFVELLGPAGSGKSTIAGALSERPEVALVWDVSAVPTHTRCVAAATALPHALRLAAAGGTKRPFGWTARVEAFRRLRPSRPVTVLDQGPAYTLARLLAARPATTHDRWFDRASAEWGRRLDTLVLLDAPDDVLVDRIMRRSKDHSFRHLSPAEAVAAVGRQRDELQRIAIVLEREGARVVHLSTAGVPPEGVAGTVASTWALVSVEEA